MTWFKVDDKFHSSVEVMSIAPDKRAAAIGLWTLAGSWSSDQLKNGFVPTTHLEAWGGTVELAEVLVSVKLWTRVGKRGFQFRNWEKWQITREQVEEAREQERDRKAAWRAARAAKQGAGPENVPRDKGGSPVGVPEMSRLSRPENVPPFPSRPDPTRPIGLKDLSTSSYVPNAESTNDDGPRFPRPNKGGGVDYNRVDAAIRQHCGRLATIQQVYTITETIIGRAGQKITSMTGLVVAGVKNDWAEWQKFIDSGKDTL